VTSRRARRDARPAVRLARRHHVPHHDPVVARADVADAAVVSLKALPGASRVSRQIERTRARRRLAGAAGEQQHHRMT
jgi:hypothetical protein